LLVDDEENLRSMLEAALRHLGFEVQSAATGREALAAAVADQPAVIVLDDDAHRVTRGGNEVSLSPTEYNLLRFLLGNKGRVLSKAQILDHVWQYDFGGDANVVETYISYLRKKLDRTDSPLIHTVRGVGYRLWVPTG